MGAMMETIGALLIALIVIGIVAVNINSAFSKAKVSSTQQDLVTIRMQTQQLFSGATDFSGLDNAIAIKAGIIPQGLIKGDTIKNRWSGDVTLGANADNASFTIALTQIPQSECTQFALFQKDAWLGIEVNGTAIDKDGNVADIINNCDATNTITYEAR